MAWSKQVEACIAEAAGKFLPGARHDDIEWITEAKRDETREQRLPTAIEWIGEGNRCGWKYEKC